MLGNSVSDSTSKTMDRAGIPGKPHSLRHWFGSTLKEASVDSLVIKELMGHESLATTAIYVQVPLKMQCSAVNLLPTFHRRNPSEVPGVRGTCARNSSICHAGLILALNVRRSSYGTACCTGADRC